MFSRTAQSQFALDPLESRFLLSTSPHVFDPGSTVAGATLGEWSARWWQWALSIPAAQNPIVDEIGANARLGQSGPVFYLAGTFGTDPVTRDIQVEAGKFLFLPLTNVAWVTLPTDPPMTIPELRDAIAPFINDVTALHATIDGQAVPDLFSHREIDPFDEGFEVTMPQDNFFGVDAGVYGPCVADGYWLMLSPLPAGTHTIEFGGSGGVFQQDITYNIDVVSPRDVQAAQTDGISTVPGRGGGPDGISTIPGRRVSFGSNPIDEAPADLLDDLIDSVAADA